MYDSILCKEEGGNGEAYLSIKSSSEGRKLSRGPSRTYKNGDGRGEELKRGRVRSKIRGPVMEMMSVSTSLTTTCKDEEGGEGSAVDSYSSHNPLVRKGKSKWYEKEGGENCTDIKPLFGRTT
ncbi:hypothetical protein BDQ12DRAFT_671493 [Crucibulum laeve]|uniref:Uncharacterized protein n=1 Tax=Crucibulum laeve TaxID=68775 RepID=A0A5C3LFM6_9AGAR|nr:hypothetical protein BDQ12DRAFT_671493 [Crucibulum laeve]